MQAILALEGAEPATTSAVEQWEELV